MSKVLSNTPPAHAVTSLAGHFLSIDDRFCELLSRERVEIIGKSIIELTVEQDRPINSEKLDRLREAGTSFIIRKRYLCGDGGTRAVENAVSMLSDGTGDAVLAATITPVSDVDALQFAATIRVARILLSEQIARLSLGPALQGIDGRILLGAYLLEAEGAAVWAHELANIAGGDPQANLFRVWELVRQGALVVDGRATSLEQASVRISSWNAALLARHLTDTLSI